MAAPRGRRAGRGRGRNVPDPMEAMNRTLQAMMARLDAMEADRYAPLPPPPPHLPPPPPPPPHMPSPPPPPVRQGVQPDRHLYEDFFKQNPPSFDGGRDTLAVINGLERIQQLFRTLPCPEEMMVYLTVSKMTGEANRWWETTRARLVQEVRPLTWALFEQEFKVEYISRDVLMQKEMEFINLTQGRMSVDEYSRKFRELLRFFHFSGRVPEDEWLCTKFQQGLDSRIAYAMMGQRLRGLTALIDQSKLMEAGLARMNDERAK